jgi:cytochrome c oxidase subunit 2
MLLRIIVDSLESFEHWLANKSGPALEDTSAREGKEVFLSQTCVNCHRVRSAPAQGGYAADLTHLMDRQTLPAGMVSNTPANIRCWLNNRGSIKPGCLMPAFGLSNREYDRIVDYLPTLR